MNEISDTKAEEQAEFGTKLNKGIHLPSSKYRKNEIPKP